MQIEDTFASLPPIKCQFGDVEGGITRLADAAKHLIDIVKRVDMKAALRGVLALAVTQEGGIAAISF
jgi:hypothetical protein